MLRIILALGLLGTLLMLSGCPQDGPRIPADPDNVPTVEEPAVDIDTDDGT